MFGKKIHYIDLPAIDSTNDELKRRILGSDESGASRPKEFTVISADYQTAGRGRSGHSWESIPGVSISTSMVVYPISLGEEKIPGLTILAAVAVCRAIEDSCPVSAGIKWVNDVLVDNKKVCGILAERIPQMDAVVIGIGVNFLKGSCPPELENMATSLQEALKSEPPVSRKKMIRGIWKHFAEYYQSYISSGNLGEITDLYNSRLVSRGREVRVMDPAGEYTAVCEHTDIQGRLIVRLPDGTTNTIDSGEVSVRGIYGYGI